MKNLHLGWVTKSVLAGLMVLNMDLAPKVAEHHEAVHRISHIANPHLHGVHPESEAVRHFEHHVAGHWYGHWSYYSWVGLHRGLGTVQGKVMEKNGSPASGVTVMLRGARGKSLKASARHSQVTSAGGVFVMSGVRTGHYRVRAERGKANGHSPITVRAGQAATAVVRI